MNLRLEQQRIFDDERFDPPHGYVELSEQDQKVRHIFEHTAGAMGKLAIGSVTTIKSEVIPDLAIYRTQLINEFDIDPEDVISRTYPGLYLPWQALGRALLNLKSYIEPREHGEVTLEENIPRAASYLHDAAFDLAVSYDVDLEAAHLQRMESQMGISFTDIS